MRTSISQARRSILYFTSRSAQALGALKLLLNTVLFRSSTSLASASFSCDGAPCNLTCRCLAACAKTAWKQLSQQAIDYCLQGCSHALNASQNVVYGSSKAL